MTTIDLLYQEVDQVANQLNAEVLDRLFRQREDMKDFVSTLRDVAVVSLRNAYVATKLSYQTYLRRTMDVGRKLFNEPQPISPFLEKLVATHRSE